MECNNKCNNKCNKWATSIDPNKDKEEDLKCIKEVNNNNIIDKVTNNPDKTLVNLPNNKLKDNNNKSNLNLSLNKNLLLKCNNNNLNNNNKVNLLP